MTRLRTRAPSRKVISPPSRSRAAQAATLLVATVVAVPLSPSATANAAEPARTDTTATTVADDRITAARAAIQSGDRVEVLSERTTTGQLFANPDGTWTSEEYAVPVRVRRGTGWVPVDTTLRAGPDGTVSPAAVDLDLRISGGGQETPLVSMGRDGRGLAVSWPGRLPAPELRGNVATYPEVLPGVDLRLSVEVTGFQQVLVVKTREAAANPALRALTFDTDTTGLTLRRESNGSLVAVDDGGKPIFGAPQPVMWDSPDDAGGDAGANRAGATDESTESVPTQKAMPTEVRADAVTIRPDLKMLADPETNYPVYIDPAWSEYKSAWLHLNIDSPNQEGWGWDQGDGAKVGHTYNDSCCVYRSIFRIPVSSVLRGATVTSASFFIDLHHTPNCTKRDVQLWETGGINTGTTWGNTGSGHWRRHLDTRAGAAYSGCTDPFRMEFGGPQVTAYLQRAANSSASEVNFGLKAPSETDQNYWKKFLPNTAYVTVNYNNPPAVPSSFTTVPPSACGTASAPTPLNTATPTFTARLTDPNRDLVTGVVEVLDGTTVLHTVNGGPIASGGVLNFAAVPAGKLPTDNPTKVFGYRARTVDAAGLSSGNTGTCYFTVDRDVPGTPQVTSTDFPFGEPYRTVGQVGVLTFSPGHGPAGLNTDVAGYRYGFQQDKLTGWVKASADGRATIPMVLWTTSRTLYVQAVDHAGNPSLEDAPCLCTAYSLAAKPGSATPARELGDVNGDGLTDVSTVFEMEFGRSAAWTFTTTSWNGSYTPYLGWDTGFNGGFPAYRTAQVNGDFTGDGLSDLALLREDPDGKIRLYIAQSDGHRYDIIGDPKWTSPAGWKLANLRAFAGDFDGDGRTDLGGVLYTATNTWTGYVWTGAGGLTTAATWYSAVNTRPIANVRFLAGDYDGDGRDDIVGVNDVGNFEMKLFTYASTGTAFNHPVQRYTSEPGNFTMDRAQWVTGNVDGDTGGTAGQGRDDLVAAYAYGDGQTRLISYMFGDAGVTWAYGWDSGSGVYNSAKSRFTAGDFNNDGRTDVAALNDFTGSTARLHFFLASGTGLFTAPDLAAPKWSGRIGAAPTNLTPETGKRYRVVAAHSNRCLEVANAGTAASAVVQQLSCQAGAGHQMVTLEQTGNGPYYYAKFAHSSQCLDVTGRSYSSDTGLVQSTCGATGGGHQQWRLEYLTGAGRDTQVRLRVAHSDQCLAITGSSTAERARAVQQTCGTGAGSSQAFYLRMEP